MKQFVKVIYKEGYWFKYIRRAYPGLNIENLKAGVCNGSGIRKHSQDKNQRQEIRHMIVIESNEWSLFVAVMKNFLENQRSDDYEEFVDKISKFYQDVGVIDT